METTVTQSLEAREMADEFMATEMPAPFVISEFDPVYTGRNGGSRITAKVNGYWSSDPMTLYIDRRFSWDRGASEEGAGKWICCMSHSSGGRDTDQVANDCDAEANFGAALIALANLGRSLLTPEVVGQLEAHFQARREEERVAREAEEAAKAALIAADTELGEVKAKALINLAIATVKAAPLTEWRNNECVVTVVAFARGADQPMTFTASATRTGMVKIYRGGKAWSTAETITFLAKASHRTAITSVVNPATDKEAS